MSLVSVSQPPNSYSLAWLLAQSSTWTGTQTFSYVSQALPGGPLNTAFGYQALTASTGGANSAFGYQALAANAAGNYNCALGRLALAANISGSYNCAFGSSALNNNTNASRNCAFGTSTLRANISGTCNDALGCDALNNCQTGSYNTACGDSALYSGATLDCGSNNIALGYYAGNHQGTVSNYLFMDALNRGTAANELVQSLIVGLMNATASSQWLAVNAGAFLLLPGTVYSSGSGIFIGSNSTNNAIWTSSQGAGNTTLYIGNASINVTASSLRWKENIAPSNMDALSVLSKLRVRDFDYKEGQWRDRGRWTGLIAEEVMKIPELRFAVTPDAVEYHHLVPTLIKAIQQLLKRKCQ